MCLSNKTITTLGHRFTGLGGSVFIDWSPLVGDVIQGFATLRDRLQEGVDGAGATVVANPTGFFDFTS